MFYIKSYILINKYFSHCKRIARCDNLQGLRFQTNNVGLMPPGDISDESLVDIEQ